MLATVSDARNELQETVRAHHGWALARLVRSTGDLQLAEDALSRAIEAALVQWPQQGVPEAPRAWLVRTARHKAIDELRRRDTWTRTRDELALLDALGDDDARGDDAPLGDDMLRLLFTCCHPALAEDARVALTLQVVGGLQADEIARAFLVPTATMAQRLVRAKRKIKHAGVPYRVPAADEIDTRASGVRAVVYLIFNEGYAATHGDAWIRHDLCRHAIRVGEALCELLGDAETTALLALMLLHAARHATREDEHGDLVLLADQDRSRWDHPQIARATALTTAALRQGPPGPYALQAAIAAVHANAGDAADTDWRELVGLYDRLLAQVPSAVVALNRAVAIAHVAGPRDGLAAIDAIAGRFGDALDDYFPLHAARADLLRRAGEVDDAIAAYRRARALCHNRAELRFLARRLAELGADD